MIVQYGKLREIINGFKFAEIKRSIMKQNHSLASHCNQYKTMFNQLDNEISKVKISSKVWQLSRITHRKRTIQVDNLTGRQTYGQTYIQVDNLTVKLPDRKTISQEDNLTVRRTCRKKISCENNIVRRQLQRKKTSQKQDLKQSHPHRQKKTI